MNRCQHNPNKVHTNIRNVAFATNLQQPIYFFATICGSKQKGVVFAK